MNIQKLDTSYLVRDVLLGFPSKELKAGATEEFLTNPQCLFKPRQLITAKRYPGVFLDACVGFCSQLHSPELLPLESFYPDDAVARLVARLDQGKISAADAPAMTELLKEVEKLRNNFLLDTVQPAMDFKIILTNRGPESQLIAMHVRGDCLLDGVFTDQRRKDLERLSEIVLQSATR